jgi:hypothetical protein
MVITFKCTISCGYMYARGCDPMKVSRGRSISSVVQGREGPKGATKHIRST